MGFLMHFIFSAAFLLIYIIAIIILKPFRIHRKRPISTILIKVSYLIYLLCFLVIAYLFMFNSNNNTGNTSGPERDNQIEKFEEKKPGESEEGKNSIDDRILTAANVFIVLAFFVPNIGIMIRRRIGTWRETYNYIVTALNILIIIGLIWFIFDIPWNWDSL